MFLVTGATGNVGGALVGTLVEAGIQVRGLVRSADRELPAGVETAVGDLNEPAGLTAAFDGVRGLFLMSGYRDMPGLLAEARRAGVQRVTLLSGGSALASDLDNAVSRYMVASEDAVRTSGMAWTLLRPSGFMTNSLAWADQVRAGDVVRAPFPEVPIATVDPGDIAAVAAGTLAGGHDGRTYRLTGPQALRPADRVRTLAGVLGRDLRYEPQGDEEAYAEMSVAMPVEYVDAFFGFYARGTLDESQVESTVLQVTGRPPRSFAQWATAHADAFR